MRLLPVVGRWRRQGLPRLRDRAGVVDRSDWLIVLEGWGWTMRLRVVRKRAVKAMIFIIGLLIYKIGIYPKCSLVYFLVQCCPSAK